MLGRSTRTPDDRSVIPQSARRCRPTQRLECPRASASLDSHFAAAHLCLLGHVAFAVKREAEEDWGEECWRSLKA
jgi:hypothetical protein